MATKSVNELAKPSPSATVRRSAPAAASSVRKSAAGTSIVRPRKAAVESRAPEVRVTKSARLLQLLSRPEGASLEDMMEATDWQQHSVRGFLAGTVRKRLGLALTSSKTEGGPRTYQIARPRGR